MATTLPSAPPAPPFPSPQGGAALPLTFHPASAPHRAALVVGTGRLAAHRAWALLDADARVVVLPGGPGGGSARDGWDAELRWRVESGQVGVMEGVTEGGEDETADGGEADSENAWVSRLAAVHPPLLLVAVTDTLLSASPVAAPATGTTRPTRRRTLASARAISAACQRLHLPVNITDHPALSTFSFPATHRFPSSAAAASSTGAGAGPRATPLSNLQISISTNHQGCRLAGRIKRDLVAGKALPRGVGGAVDNVGRLRRRAREMRGGTGVGASRDGRAAADAASVLDGRPTPGAASGSTSTPLASSSVSGSRAGPAPAEPSSDIDTEDDPSAFSGPLNSPVPQLASPALSRSSSYASLGVLPATASASASAPASKTASPSTREYFDRAVAGAREAATPAAAPADAPALSPEEEQLRRMRWIAQISEYWSMEYLARMSDGEMDRVLHMWGEVVASAGAEGAKGAGGAVAAAAAVGGPGGPANGISSAGVNPAGGSEPSAGPPVTPRHGLALGIPTQPPPHTKGRILLLGSGPGHPSLLTVAAHRALQTSTLILSDKLVPSEILALIPPTTTLHIAKKFPGNAEGAQNEMMELALEGALRGEVVVRLKQGDPFVYGRGGEEVLFFREHGFECVVVPGVSSALAGPLMMGIPVTQRGVAESMVLCTGVGRKGKAVQLPGYLRSRTLVVLMGVARIRQVIDVLTRPGADAEGRDGPAYPRNLPIAIIERASSHDQRMVASTLEGIEEALANAGDQRPPGMMIIGWACLALEGAGEVTVLDDDEDDGTPARDQQRVDKWLGGKPFLLKDGLGEEWAQFLTPEVAAQIEQAAAIDNYQEYNRG